MLTWARDGDGLVKLGLAPAEALQHEVLGQGGCGPGVWRGGRGGNVSESGTKSS